MKHIIYFLFTCLSIQLVAAQELQPNPNKKIITAEASCGQCKFGLKGKSCDLAVRINGKAYFVDGTKIDDHGDAHAAEGFCNAIRKATVQGEVVNDRFKATYFKLLPIETTPAIHQ